MKRSVWLWFFVGGLVTFVGLAIVLKTFVMSPSGTALTRVPLWRYYMVEWPRVFDRQLLGPASGDPAALLVVALQHLGLAAIGGAACAEVAWWVRRRKADRQ